MLLALRSLWEQQVVVAPAVVGGAPRVNFAEFYKLKAEAPEIIVDRLRRRIEPAVAIALLASGQITEHDFAALLAA